MAAAAPLMLIAGVAKGAGELQKGSAAKEAGEYNASIADFNAAQTEADGAVRLQQQQNEAAQVIGHARAAYGASGVDSTQGSALDILKQSATQSAMDSLNLKRSTEAKAYGYRQSANVMRQEGQTAQDSSYLSAAGQLLGGVGDFTKAGGFD